MEKLDIIVYVTAQLCHKIWKHRNAIRHDETNQYDKLCLIKYDFMIGKIGLPFPNVYVSSRSSLYYTILQVKFYT